MLSCDSQSLCITSRLQCFQLQPRLPQRFLRLVTQTHESLSEFTIRHLESDQQLLCLPLSFLCGCGQTRRLF